MAEGTIKPAVTTTGEAPFRRLRFSISTGFAIAAPCDERGWNRAVRLRRLAPGRFVLLFVIVECLDQAVQHLGRGFEHGRKLGLVDLVDVLTQMRHGLLQALLYFLGMVQRVLVGG